MNGGQVVQSFYMMMDEFVTKNQNEPASRMKLVNLRRYWTIWHKRHEVHGNDREG
jgi:hypothetical protein